MSEEPSNSRKAKLLFSLARESDLSVKDMYSLAKKAESVPGVDPKQILSVALSNENGNSDDSDGYNDGGDESLSGKEKVTQGIIGIGLSISNILGDEVDDLEDEWNIDELEKEQESGSGLDDIMNADDEDAHEVVSNFNIDQFEKDMEQYSVDSITDSNETDESN